MKKSLIVLTALALCVAAHATDKSPADITNNYDQRTYNQPTATGQGGAGGAGGQGGAVLGSGNSANQNANLQGQAQGQAQGQQQQALGGAGYGSAKSDSTANATGNGAGNKTDISFGGDTYERSAPSVFVQGGTPLPTGCRYVFGIGGSNTGGSVSTAGIPLWKDSECTGAAAIGAMGKAPNGTYTAEDYRVVSCENFDAMANTPTCRNLRSKQAMDDAARRDAVAQFRN